eukprot:12735528-Prorocentrum_lima.AAC.1
MTSSLAGSEMCIRDSLHVEAVFDVVKDCRTSSCDIANCLDLVLLDILPVSYTHLTLPTICSV